MKARGMVNMMMKGSRRDWNWATMTKYTSTMPSSSISSTWPMASMICSFSPLNSMVAPSGSSMASTALVTWSDTRVTFLPSAMPAVTVTQRRCWSRLMVFRLTVFSTVATSFSRKLLSVSSSSVPDMADREEEDEPEDVPPLMAEDMALSGSIFSSGRVSTVILLLSSCWMMSCMEVSSSTMSVPVEVVFRAAATCI